MQTVQTAIICLLCLTGKQTGDLEVLEPSAVVEVLYTRQEQTSKDQLVQSDKFQS